MKQIRYFLEAILLFILLVISKALPVATASNFGGWVGRTIGPRLAASRKAKRNIEMVFPNKDEHEVQRIVTGMWDNLGRVMMEYPHLEKIAKTRTKFIGAENLQNIENGSIMISAHQANWEIVPPTILFQGKHQATPVYRAPNNPYSDYLLKKARSINNQIDSIPKSKGGTRNIVKLLKEKGHVGLVIDQKYNEGIEVDFLGHPAMTSDAFAQLTQKFNAPLIPIKVERLENCRFHVTILPAIDTVNKSAEQIVLQSHDLLKDWITDKPEHWLWLHNRWKNKSKNKNKKKEY